MPLTVRDGFDQLSVLHHNSDQPHRNETGEETGAEEFDDLLISLRRHRALFSMGIHLLWCRGRVRDRPDCRH